MGLSGQYEGQGLSAGDDKVISQVSDVPNPYYTNKKAVKGDQKRHL